jgi:hypothetical protein
LETQLTQALRDGRVDGVAYDPRPIFWRESHLSY